MVTLPLTLINRPRVGVLNVQRCKKNICYIYRMSATRITRSTFGRRPSMSPQKKQPSVKMSEADIRAADQLNYKRHGPYYPAREVKGHFVYPKDTLANRGVKRETKNGRKQFSRGGRKSRKARRSRRSNY
jgi:hypothetical protein